MTKPHDTVISVSSLVKQYGEFVAVKGISFDVKRGEVFGLLGENGAGKTTTLEMLEGLREPSGGDAVVLGHHLTDIGTIKERIGVQLQSSAYFNFLTLVEILRLFANFYHRSVDPLKLLSMVDLSDKATSYLNSLSGGQKQRFSIAASLINDPEIVFLDEPTTGLDPNARRNLWELIETIRKEGKTIILTTHYMEEAERLCDRIAIMDSGQFLVIDKTADLLHRAPNPHSIAFTTSHIPQKAEEELRGLATGFTWHDQSYDVSLETQADLQQALKIIVGLEPTNLRVSHASLEDVFIHLTGKSLEV